MAPTTKPRPVMSTPLRVFIGISIALHVTLVGFIVVPSILGLFRKQDEPLSEEQVMLMKQRAAEKVTQDAAREEIRKELAKTLKEDLRSVAGDLTPAKFEQFWTNSLSAIQSNLDNTAEELAKGNLADLSPHDLEAALAGLRQAEIDALMAKLGDASKDEIAAQVLSSVAATLPEFNQKAKDLMDQTESPKVRSEVDKLLADERNRRQKELAAAHAGLTMAQQQVEQARTQSAAISSSLGRTLGENQKRAEAAAKADASVEQALLAAAAAERHATALDQALASKASSDEKAAQGDALLKDAAKSQAELEKALAGAQSALQEASAHAAQAKAPEARDGLADAADQIAKTTHESVKAAAVAIHANDPAAATLASEKTAATLVDAARQTAAMSKSLAAAAGSTNAAVAKPAAAAQKSAAAATDLLDKAIASARATADAARHADEQQRAALAAATEPARSTISSAVKEARAAVDHAIKTASEEKAGSVGRTLQDTSTALAKVLAPATAELERQIGGTNRAAATGRAEKLAAELDAAARKMGDDGAALTQEARDRRSPALAREASALSEATAAVREATTQAQRVAGALAKASAPDAGKHDAREEAAKASVSEAQDGTRSTLEGAAREMRSTASTLADKAEKPVADALSAAARLTDAVVSGPVKRTADLGAAGNARAALLNTPLTHAAISNLVDELSRTRGELAAMTGKPTADEVNVATAAHVSIGVLAKTLDCAEDHLEKAAAAADKGSEAQASHAIEQSAKSVRDTGESVVAQAADALTPKPADARNPQAGPRPGRKEMSVAQRDMEAATNRLSDLTRQIADHKAVLSGASSRFESNVVATVDTALTRDPALQAKTREFVRQTLREQVATEFRAKTEALVEKVLEKKGMDPDPRFVRRVGQQAAELLLAGSESNLFDSAFAEMMTPTAKEFGVKPEDLRKRATDETGKDDAEEGADDGTKGPEVAQGENHGKHKKKHKKGLGPETTDAGEDGGDDDAGMNALATSLEGSLAKSLQHGTQSAISRSANTSLHLPGADSFGESTTDSLRGRLAGAKGGAMRSMATGGRESLIAGMSDNLARFGQTLRTGASSGRRNGLFYENPEEYRKNLETVIKGREVKEAVLVAPSLTNPVSVASSEVFSNRPALILVGSRGDLLHAPTNVAATVMRSLAPPEFTSFAYGGAPFATNPPVIDGDLSDWEGVQPFMLRGTLSKSEWHKPFPVAWETNRYLMVQWDYTGFYFAFKVVDDADNTDVDARNFWAGDCLELWFDFSNRRTDARSEDQQQFWFWPLGSRYLPGIIGGEAIMPANRYDARFRANSTSPNDPRMAVKRTTNPRGYQVEVYMPLACFRKPDMTPGRIIAFDFSIHNGEGAYLRWTTELGKAESITPSVWGDLVLLGSDAQILAVKPRKTSEPLLAIIPGEPLGVRLFDPDMNTDPHVRNQVKVKFESGEGHALLGYLQETDVNTGIFEGSIDTVEVLPGEDCDITNNALPVVCGGYAEISYYDQARRYGERNYTVRKRVPVGVPVMRMSAKK